MEIQGFEKAGIVQSCLLLKCQGAKIGINRQPLFNMHPTGIEPTHMAPEAIALSTELQMHLLYDTTLFQNLQGVPANFLYIFLRPPISVPGSRTLVSGFPQTGLPVFDGLFRTPADAGHTVGTV